eukprot:s686_g15.t1
MGNATAVAEATRPDLPKDAAEDDLQAREVARPEASIGSGTIEGPSGEALNIVVFGEDDARASQREDDRSSATGRGTWRAGNHISPLVGPQCSSGGYTLPTQAWTPNLQMSPMSAVEAEAEVRRRAMEIMKLQRQVELLQAELATPTSSLAQAQILLGAFPPEIRVMQDGMQHAMYVGRQLDDWFTEHVDKLLIDPKGFNPSRRMRISLESANQMLIGFTNSLSRVEGLLQEASKVSQKPKVPGQQPGPTPEGARPGGAGVPGLWVRDPDVFSQ